jgi:hypothetical protein
VEEAMFVYEGLEKAFMGLVLNAFLSLAGLGAALACTALIVRGGRLHLVVAAAAAAAARRKRQCPARYNK